MFERKKFKRAALQQLKKRWKIPVLTTLLIFVITFVLYVALLCTFAAPSYSFDVFEMGVYFTNENPSTAFSLASLLISCIAIVFFVAQLNVCLLMVCSERKICFSDFTNGLSQWWQSLRGALWFFLWVFLWSLLFFFPGIVKAYSYSQMFFVMAENPHIGAKQAMRISRELTRGYKGDLFVLDLSFLLWIILASISCGIGYLWLSPYVQMTRANVYQYLKTVALNTKRVCEEDFLKN